MTRVDFQVFADGLADERFDLGRRHPANRPGVPGLSLQQG